jgi:hypothetical protein
MLPSIFVLLSLFLARVSNVLYATYPWFYTWKTVEDTAMKFLSSGVSYSSIKFQFENSKEEHREVTTRSTNPLFWYIMSTHHMSQDKIDPFARSKLSQET